MNEEDVREQLQACHRLRKASEHQFQAVEKLRMRALELASISKKLLATAKLLQQELSKKER